ncbi:UNVERIFIED_CONTAM: hypothetical protein NCL1_61733 [Trichonephila clavipes]
MLGQIPGSSSAFEFEQNPLPLRSHLHFRLHWEWDLLMMILRFHRLHRKAPDCLLVFLEDI